MAIAKKPKWAQVILNFVERFCDKEKWVLWFKIVVACLPTIVIALPFDDFIEEHFNNYVVVAISIRLKRLASVFSRLVTSASAVSRLVRTFSPVSIALRLIDIATIARR